MKIFSDDFQGKAKLILPSRFFSFCDDSREVDGDDDDDDDDDENKDEDAEDETKNPYPSTANDKPSAKKDKMGFLSGQCKSNYTGEVSYMAEWFSLYSSQKR